MLHRLKIKKPSMKNKISHQNDVICFKICSTSFDWKKNVKDSIKHGLIITATTTRIFYVLKVANIKPPKVSLDAMDIMKIAGGIVGGILVKDYVLHKKWINEWYNKKFYGPLKGNKITWHHRPIEKRLSCWADPWAQANTHARPLLLFNP